MDLSQDTFKAYKPIWNTWNEWWVSICESQGVVVGLFSLAFASIYFVMSGYPDR
jgi:hypothetical protein